MTFGAWEYCESSLYGTTKTTSPQQVFSHFCNFVHRVWGRRGFPLLNSYGWSHWCLRGKSPMLAVPVEFRSLRSRRETTSTSDSGTGELSDESWNIVAVFVTVNLSLALKAHRQVKEELASTAISVLVPFRRRVPLRASCPKKTPRLRSSHGASSSKPGRAGQSSDGFLERFCRRCGQLSGNGQARFASLPQRRDRQGREESSATSKRPV